MESELRLCITSTQLPTYTTYLLGTLTLFLVYPLFARFTQVFLSEPFITDSHQL